MPRGRKQTLNKQRENKKKEEGATRISRHNARREYCLDSRNTRREKLRAALQTASGESNLFSRSPRYPFPATSFSHPLVHWRAASQATHAVEQRYSLCFSMLHQFPSLRALPALCLPAFHSSKHRTLRFVPYILRFLPPLFYRFRMLELLSLTLVASRARFLIKPRIFVHCNPGESALPQLYRRRVLAKQNTARLIFDVSSVAVPLFSIFGAKALFWFLNPRAGCSIGHHASLNNGIMNFNKA